MQLTPEQLKEKYQKLPDDVREALYSESVANSILTIGESNNIDQYKITELADEVGLVMYGITNPKNFISNLSSRLGTDITIARKIAEEVNSQIFSKVRESLKKIHGIASDVPVAPSVVPPIPSPTPTSVSIAPEEKISPFEAKTKQEIFRAAPEESKQIEVPNLPPAGYSGGKDPYRESID